MVSQQIGAPSGQDGIQQRDTLLPKHARRSEQKRIYRKVAKIRDSK
jgi:hypothetical protein